ncbi:hypothetical protein [Streptomyces sp. NPDC088261]|uniref:hypothetical protein n=1 Tax=Streptomyces sp. NPDC088261 TaxID=3365851 RepID=UPI0038014C6C
MKTIDFLDDSPYGRLKEFRVHVSVNLDVFTHVVDGIVRIHLLRVPHAKLSGHQFTTATMRSRHLRTPVNAHAPHREQPIKQFDSNVDPDHPLKPNRTLSIILGEVCI